MDSDIIVCLCLSDSLALDSVTSHSDSVILGSEALGYLLGLKDAAVSRTGFFLLRSSRIPSCHVCCTKGPESLSGLITCRNYKAMQCSG